MKRFLILSAICIALCPNLAFATEWFAKKTGSDSNNCTAAQSSSTPKLTIAAALACVGSAGTTAGADDFVTVSAGNWGEDLTDLIPGGTSGHKFTLRCDVQNACVFYGTIGFNVASSYIRITGFEATEVGGVYGGFNTSSHVANTFHDIEYDHLYIHDIQEFAFGGFSGAKNVWYHDNITDDTATNCTYPGGAPPAPGLCHSLYVSSYSSDWIIENSVFKNNYLTGGYCVHIFYQHDTEDPTEVPTNFIIRNNVIENCGNVSVGGNGAGIVIYGSGHQIYNNVIINQPLYGILDRSSSATMDFNTIYNAAIYGIANQGGCTARNNLIIASGNAAFSPDDVTFDDCGTKTTNVTTGSGGAHFVNAGGGDFHLISTSAALGAGTAISITTDKDGNTRANPPAAGAYDSVVGGGGSCGVSPTSALAEDFSSYTNGDSLGTNTRNGGAGWTNCWTVNAGTAPTVTSSPGCSFSNKSMISSGVTGLEDVSRSFTAHTGAFSIIYKTCISTNTPNGYLTFALLNESGQQAARVFFSPTSGNMVTDAATLVSGYAANTAYTVECRFDTVNQPNKYSCRVNGGSYSAYEPTVVSFTGIAGFKFLNAATNAHNLWIDDFSESDGAGGGAVGNLTLSSPGSAGTCRFGSTCSIDWAATNITGTVNLYYLVGGNQYLIASPAFDAHPYSWTVNAPSGTSSQLRITQGAVTNDGPTFTIESPYRRAR